MNILTICGYYEDGYVEIENGLNEDYREFYEGEDSVVIEINDRDELFSVVGEKLEELSKYMKGCGFEFGEDDVDNEFYGMVMGLKVKRVVVWSVEYDMSISVEFD
jgi:hypothetical protein